MDILTYLLNSLLECGDRSVSYFIYKVSLCFTWLLVLLLLHFIDYSQNGLTQV